MGSAYVPGLKVSGYTELNIERRLPLKGCVVVQEGQKVNWDTTVANTFLPGRAELLNVAAKLGISADGTAEAMLKKEGDSVEKGETLACSKGFFGWFKTNLASPITGTLESVSEVSGIAVLRAPAVPVEINAYTDGEIVKVLDDEGVVVRTKAAYVQGIFGIGGETSGELFQFCEAASEEMDAEKLSKQHRGKILFGGSHVSCAFLKKAASLGVKAVVCGAVSDKDLTEFLGYDLGVAVTGSEQVGLTLILTEGFGRIDMAERTFRLLQEHIGKRASVSGATQIRAGVIRPEIIIPVKNGSDSEEKAKQALGLTEGAAVRLIREPRFGELAEVVSLPAEPEKIPTGAKVRIAEVRLSDGTVMRLPRANLELIER